MSPIETIIRPRRNKISLQVPSELGSYFFHVIMVPLGADEAITVRATANKPGSFVDALLSCPKLDEGEALDVTRASDDFGRDVEL